MTTASVLARRAPAIFATLGLSLLSAATGVALLGVSGWFLTGAAVTTAALAFNLFGPSALVRGLSFLRIGSRYGEKLVGHGVTLAMLGDIREGLFRRLIPRVPFHGVGLRHGELVSRLMADVEALDAVLVGAIAPAGTALATGVGLGALLVWFLPTAAAIFAAGFAAAALAVPLCLVLAMRRAGRALIEHKAQLRMTVLDGIEGHADLVAFGRTGDAQATAAAAVSRLAGTARVQSRAAAAGSAAVVLLAGLTAPSVLVLGLDAVRAHELGGPTLVGLVLAVLASFEVVAPLVRNAGRIATATAAATRLRAMATARPATSEPHRPVPLPAGSDLVFQDVWFSHRSERPLLRGLSLTCPAGSRTVLLGDSGCGKSTLLDLALRLADPDTGAVRVAGVDVADVAQADLHRRVALMSQATPVFLGTIRDNLRLGRADAADEDLWQALEQARIAPFVRSLPDGFDTWCGEGGRTLSGGEARRLCLGRTLLTQSPILLLDEPTAGLDRETEQAFFEDLAAATAGRTVLLVTHAALPPGAADRVVLLTEGQIVDVD